MNNLTKGLIVSLILHVVLLVSLRYIRVGRYFGEPEYVEVGLLEYVIPAKTPAEAHPGVISEEAIAPTVPVTLPEAKEGEEEVVTQERPVKELPPVYHTGEGEVKETPSSSFQEGESYLIEGELSKRKVVYKIIPAYPEGYNIEADVKVEIWVSPGGDVERLTLIKKGGDLFDRITLDALREWRFEKLPSYLPQEPQKGTVTFMYRLR